MKTVIIVALLLTSILFLGSMEVVEARCGGDLITYSVYFVDSNGKKGTGCAEICFDDGMANVSINCGDQFGIFAAEVGEDGDFGKDKYNYVGEIVGQACHLYVWNFKGSYFELDCAAVDSGYSSHRFGESSDCECPPS